MKKRTIKQNRSDFKIDEAVYGQALIFKIRAYLNKDEEGTTVDSDELDIHAVAANLFTNRDDGVLPGYNIRTDRFEVAIEAAEKLSQAKAARYAKKADLPTEASIETKNEEKKE